MTCCAVKLVALFLSQGKDLLKQHNFPFDLSDRRRVTKKLYRLIEIIFAGSHRTEFIAFAFIFCFKFLLLLFKLQQRSNFTGGLPLRLAIYTNLYRCMFI